MDTQTLVSLGLTESQAKAYIILVRHGAITAPLVATKIHETRSNAYKIRDKLTELGLARRDDAGKKLTYRVENPVALETIAIQKRNAMLEQEKQIRNAMPLLLNYFYTLSEQPGVRFFTGVDGLRELLEDILRVRKDVYVLRSPADSHFFGQEFFVEYRKKRAKLGIKTHLVTADNPFSRISSKSDEASFVARTWLPSDTYTAAVEWDIYGDRIAIISYGQEAIGILIESPQIAESFRQIFLLLQGGRFHAPATKRDKTASSNT